MRFSHCTIFVPNPTDAAEFYARAFIIDQLHIHPDGRYAEMSTGYTTLTFAHPSLASGSDPETHSGFEITLTTDDVHAAFASALCEGASAIRFPVRMPWGQTEASVRDPWGTVILMVSPRCPSRAL
jgi:lactoylglutathione lyase